MNQLKSPELAKDKIAKEPLAIFNPRCHKKHALYECPLDKTTMNAMNVAPICNIYELNHPTDDCIYLPIAKSSLVNVVMDLKYVTLRMGNQFSN